DKATASQKQNISVLTDAQKVKLNMLSDAVKLAPIISEAQSGNLLGATNSQPFGFADFLLGSVTTSLIGVPSGVSGCGFPGNVIPANRIFGAPPGTSQSGVNETAASAGPSGYWFTETPAARQSSSK